MNRCKLLIVACCFLFPTQALAAEPNIAELLVSNTPEHLVVYLKLENCFTEKMEEAILAGIPTTFRVILELCRERRFWFDKKMSAHEVSHTIKYDNIKKIFYVLFSEGGKEPEQFKGFSEAKDVMAELNGVPLTPLTELTRGERYYLRAKAKLDQVRLPLYLEYVFFFVSLWDFETDWARQDFVY